MFRAWRDIERAYQVVIRGAWKENELFVLLAATDKNRFTDTSVGVEGCRSLRWCLRNVKCVCITEPADSGFHTTKFRRPIQYKLKNTDFHAG